MESLRAALVSDDPLVLAGLTALLSGREELTVAGRLAPGALEDLAPLRADVAVVDAGAAAVRELAARLPVVALVEGPDQAAEAVAAGARGALGRGGGADRLAAAVVAAARGLVALDGALAGALLAPAPRPAPAPGDEVLTPREAEVLELLAEGLPNKQVAARLGISERTARFHVEAILAKLGAASRSEAIVLAARRGLVTL